jgi:type II secretory pathway component PulF
VYRIILVGESSGNLAAILKDVINLLKSKNELKKKMILSWIYPSFMVSFVFVVMLIFAFGLMPKMESFRKELGGELPPIAQLLNLYPDGLYIRYCQ